MSTINPTADGQKPEAATAPTPSQNDGERAQPESEQLGTPLDSLIASIAADPARAAATIKELRAEAAANRKAANELSALRRTLEEAERQKREAEQREAEKRGEWERLANERAAELEALRKQVEQLSSFQQAFIEMLERRIQAIPEPLRKRLPEYDDPIRTLRYINDNPDLFTEARKAPNLNQQQGNVGGNAAEAASREAMRAAYLRYFGG
jgi:chromosome segregation ATPase